MQETSKSKGSTLVFLACIVSLEHVLLPILGRAQEQKAAEQKPSVQKTRGTLV
jgi:hypothetical protein